MGSLRTDCEEYNSVPTGIGYLPLFGVSILVCVAADRTAESVTVLKPRAGYGGCDAPHRSGMECPLGQEPDLRGGGSHGMPGSALFVSVSHLENRLIRSRAASYLESDGQPFGA